MSTGKRNRNSYMRTFIFRLRGMFVATVSVLAAVVLCVSCGSDFRLPGAEPEVSVSVCRFDRLESRYLTTGDFSALQQMETDYPMETKTLIEQVLHIGIVEDPDINNKFLVFFQDSTLQALVSDVEVQYANMDDINEQLTLAFRNLKRELPDVEIPKVYAQISALDQSIVIGENTIGISLDKYLGEYYPLYQKYYRSEQRSGMSRENIVPDCVSFYLLSLYPLRWSDTCTQQERDMHIGKVMWVTNKMLETDFFRTKYVDEAARYMSANKDVSIDSLLTP